VAQHGVVSRAQLLDLGYSRTGIKRRLDKRRLHRVHRGVYAVGHTRLTARGRWMAAVLACGPGALLSHLDAAALHDLRRIGSGRVHVTAPGRHNLPGIRCHWARAPLHPDDSDEIDGIAVTSLARTYLDIAERLTLQRLIEALEAGERQNKLDIGAVRAVMDRSPGRLGRRPLTNALDQLGDDPAWLQSGAETAFRDLVRAHGLPEPEYNVSVEGEVVDAVWRAHRLVVEVDGWNYHRGKRSFADDRRRDRALVRAGWRVVRFTAADVFFAPDAVAAELSELLWPGGPWPRPATPGR
jgi:very-short-patch-repair endonuclease